MRAMRKARTYPPALQRYFLTVVTALGLSASVAETVLAGPLAGSETYFRTPAMGAQYQPDARHPAQWPGPAGAALTGSSPAHGAGQSERIEAVNTLKRKKGAGGTYPRTPNLRF